MIGKLVFAAKRAEGTSLRPDVFHAIDYQCFAVLGVKRAFRVKLIIRAMQCGILIWLSLLPIVWRRC